MKSSLALVSLLSLVFAAPPPPPQLYTLSTKSDKANSLSNLYLSPKGGIVGAFAESRSASTASKFATEEYKPTGTLSIHPVDKYGIDSYHQISLRGTNGLLELVNLREPTAENIGDVPTMWSVFTIGPRGNIGVKDGTDNPHRTWVTWLETDGSYFVGLWDGVTPQPRALSNITLVATKAKA